VRPGSGAGETDESRAAAVADAERDILRMVNCNLAAAPQSQLFDPAYPHNIPTQTGGQGSYVAAPVRPPPAPIPAPDPMVVYTGIHQPTPEVPLAIKGPGE
jgi:hypothetical protein